MALEAIFRVQIPNQVHFLTPNGALEILRRVHKLQASYSSQKILMAVIVPFIPIAVLYPLSWAPSVKHDDETLKIIFIAGCILTTTCLIHSMSFFDQLYQVKTQTPHIIECLTGYIKSNGVSIPDNLQII